MDKYEELARDIESLAEKVDEELDGSIYADELLEIAVKIRSIPLGVKLEKLGKKALRNLKSRKQK